MNLGLGQAFFKRCCGCFNGIRFEAIQFMRATMREKQLNNIINESNDRDGIFGNLCNMMRVGVEKSQEAASLLSRLSSCMQKTFQHEATYFFITAKMSSSCEENYFRKVLLPSLHLFESPFPMFFSSCL